MEKKTIKYKCPGCGILLEVSRSAAGKNIKCGKCGDEFTTTAILQKPYLEAGLVIAIVGYTIFLAFLAMQYVLPN